MQASVSLKSHCPTVYLAGPMVFEANPDDIFSAMKQICVRHQLQGISPLDNQLGLERRCSGRVLTDSIVEADISLMRQVDAGVFCLDGFRRGPEMDPGTAFEVGYMHALGKPLVGWTRDPREYPARVREFFVQTFGLALEDGFASPTRSASGIMRDADGVLVHSEGCLQNAMVHVAIERSGGMVHAHQNWQIAFERAIANLCDILVGTTGISETGAPI